jgi:hypothetical protein
VGESNGQPLEDGCDCLDNIGDVLSECVHRVLSFSK